MARTQHDLTWLNLSQTDANPTVSNDPGTAGTLPNIQHMPNGEALIHTGPNNYIRVPANRIVNCVETVVP